MNRNILIAGLAVFTIALGGFSLYIGLQLSDPGETTSPQPSSAGATNCQVTCGNGETFRDANPGGGSFTSCEQWAGEACNGREGIASSPPYTYSDGGGDDEGDDGGGGDPTCVIDTPSVENSYIRTDGCGTLELEVYIEDAGDRDSAGDCVGTSGGRENRSISDGQTVNVTSITNQCGKCVQIDVKHPDTGRNYATATYTGDCQEETPDPESYNCDTNIYQCVKVDGTGGTYSSRSACDDNCIPPEEAESYECDLSTYQCVVRGDDQGTYASISECADNCFPPVEGTSYTCDENTYQCIELQDESGEYLTMAACDENCQEEETNPLCGSTCDPTEINACPTGLVCSPNSNTCVLEECLDDDSCTDNGCRLPETAFGLGEEEGSPYLLVALSLLCASAIFFLLKDVPYVQHLVVGIDSHTSKKLRISQRLYTERSRKSYQDKFND